MILKFATMFTIHPALRGGAAHTAGFFGQLKHIYKKSAKNSVFCSVFNIFSVKNAVIYTFSGLKPLFSVKNAVIYTFFGLKPVQNTGFCTVFNALASKNHSKYRYLQCFSFLSVFPLPEADQNDPKFRFNTLLSSDTQKSSKKHANTTNTRSRCEILFGSPPHLKLIQRLLY